MKYFLPHHCVLRKDSLTTKLRVVFDGSMKTSSAFSLNDIILKGYTVQQELFDILICFRTFKYVFTAVIRKMFSQIRINPEQRFLEHFVALLTSRRSVMHWITNCDLWNKYAPFLSTRCLLELALSHKDSYLLANDALLNSC